MKIKWPILVWAFLTVNAAHAQIYVSDLISKVGEYDLNTGAAINTSFISGLNGPDGVVVSGSNLYVAIDNGGGKIAEYNATTGAVVNATFITGLGAPSGIVLSGGNLYVTNFTTGTIGEYNATTGAIVNASLVTGLTSPASIVLFGANLFVVNYNNGVIGEYNATTGAVVNASFISGLTVGPTIAISGSTLYVSNGSVVSKYDANTGAVINASFIGRSATSLAIVGSDLYVGGATIGEYDANTGVAIDTALVSGLGGTPSIAVVGPSTPTDIGGYNIQKGITYDQTDPTTVTLDPESPYQLYTQIEPGSTGTLLPYSSLSGPSGSTGTISYQSSSTGLQCTQDFQSKSDLDTAFPLGTYNLTIQTSTPNTYAIPVALGADNYPSVNPQLVTVSNATWVNGHLLITNPAQPTTFTWPAFNSANGSIFFQIDGNGQSFASDGTQTSITIPGGTFTNNTAVQGSLNFTNSQFDSSTIPGVNGGSSYAIQVNFVVETGSPTVTPPTFNAVDKGHVLLQTSNNAPANGVGDNDALSTAPYLFHAQSTAGGTITGHPLAFSADNSDNNAPYRFSSGPITDQATLDSTYPDGNYTLIDGQSVSLTGDAYPNTPQIIQVNGATPIWNAQGQLVLNPGIINTLTWTAFNVIATTFATNGHEELNFQSDGDDLVNVKQVAGVGESSNAPFNTLVIPANSLTGERTYVGQLQYILASSITSPSTSVYDVAAYVTETDFVAIASNAVGLTQTLTFTTLNPQQVVGTTATLLATASSGLPVAYSVISGPATVSGNVLTFNGTGSVTVQASQAGNATYANASNVTQTVTVGTIASGGNAQMITFPAIISPHNAGMPLTLTASSTSGLPIVYTVTTGPAVINGDVLTFTGAGTVTVKADQLGNGTFAAAATVPQTFAVNAPVELNFYQVEKNTNFVQSSAAVPTADPKRPFEFISYVNVGSTGFLLSTSTLTPPAGTVATINYTAAIGGLNFDEGFMSKTALDTAFPSGNYNLTIQTNTPNTYTGTLSLGTDNYPSVTPQITGLTNATWSGGHILVTDPAQPTTITWTTFNSAIGAIYLNVNGVLNQTFPADATHNNFTIPANTLTTNTLYHATLGFQNATGSSAIGGVSGSGAYTYQVNFNLQVGTPTAVPNIYIVKKDHVLVQNSANAPIDANGDIQDPAPYNIDIESATAGSTTGPGSINYTLHYDVNGGEASYGGYSFSSGSISNLATLNSTYADGNYVLGDGSTAALTGDNYPNTPHVTLVNGLPPIWNAAGQLVLDPSVTNTMTWTAFSVSAGTFASNGHEEAQVNSDNANDVSIDQNAGVTASSNVAFNTLSIPPGMLTTNHTYTGRIDYILASSINNPSANNYDIAGYDTETVYSILAQPLPTAFGPTFNSATDIGTTTNGYIATGQNLTLTLNFNPTAATTLTVINNTGSGPITGTFNNVAEGGTISTVFNSVTYTFTATYHGGDGNDMTLTYTPPLPPSSVTILHSFNDGTVPNDGAGPSGKLVLGPDGNYYGITSSGGANLAGVAFKMTPTGQVTILHSFGDSTVPNDGQEPAGALALGSDGNFYGVTQNGGSNGTGTAFRMTPQGSVTILHSFLDGSVANDGQNPDNALILASDGNFYCTTFGGGATGAGTVFKMSMTGQVTILHSFGDGTVANDGIASAGPLIQASDGNFYGTTQNGGTATQGTVFKITPQGQLTILHSFGDGTIANDGAGPQQGLVQGPDGNFYGLTEIGGVRSSFQGAGIAYKVTPQGAFTILHRFNDGSVRNDGQIPSGELILAKDGNYYGVTQNGGGTTQLQDLGTGDGTIFQMTPQGVITILHSFNDGSVLIDGAVPLYNLVQTSDGMFYSATSQGGSAEGGAVFKFTPGLPSITSSITTNGSVGLPFSYQVTATNLPTSYSAANLPAGLSIDAGTGLISGLPTSAGTTVATLTMSNSTGPASSPLTITIAPLPAPVITSILSAYGTSGKAFSYSIIAANNPTSYTASTLPHGLSFDPLGGVISGKPTVTGDYSITLTAANSGGTSPSYVLIIHLFGTTPSASQEYNVLHRFDPNAVGGDAQNPTALFQGFDGTFYGVSSNGGQFSLGTVFNTTYQGITSTVNSFGSGKGDALASAPQGLLQAADGNLYGTTLTGGSANYGTIFKIAADGTLTILHNFGDGSVANDGQSPQSAGLTQGVDGNFYGVTEGGGSKRLGTIYRITPLGILSILHSFGDNTMASDGSSPRDTLLQSSDGNFYGTTPSGGANGSGTVFKVTPLGVVTVLHSFGDPGTPNDGANPYGSLISATDGSFYGTAKNGGAHGSGTVFKMTSGTVSTLYSFGTAATDGANPIAALIQGFDGNFYGTTNLGGSANQGTVFEITSAGVETLIHQFGDATVTDDGAFPTSSLAQDANGNYYGTTSGGGTNSNGTVFTFVTTQPTSHVPIFTGTTTVTSAELTPLNFTPKAFFDVSTGDGTNTFQTEFVTQLVHPDFSVATSWVLTGTLPQFLSFDSASGTITGTPIQSGTYTISMMSVNASGSGAPATVTIYVDVPPAITSPGTASGSVGSIFSYPIAANANPTSFGATGLPGWLSVNTLTGVISGTPPGSGTYQFSPTATNVAGTGTKLVTLTIASGGSSTPFITSAATTQVVVGNAFTYQITATNSPTNYSALSLPSGLVFNSATGAITGTPTSVGTYSVPISATNGSGTSSSVLLLTVDPAIAPVITSSTAVTCTPSAPVTYQIIGTNSPRSFTASGLPSGLSLNPSTGAITGTPANAGDSSVTLTATNSIGTGTATLALSVQPANSNLPTVTSSANASTAATLPYTYQVVATNNPTSFDATGLPPGLSIDTATGIISGTPTANGTYNVTVYATSTTLGTGAASLTLTVSSPTYAQWASIHTGASSPTATPDNDSVPNLLKYCFDIDPTHTMTSTDRAALPALGMATDGTNDYLTLSYHEYRFATGIALTLQSSTDMKTWTDVDSPAYMQSSTDPSSGDTDMQVGVKMTGGKLFLRLNASAP